MDHALMQNKFYIRTAEPGQLLWSCPAAKLLKPDKMSRFLELYGQRIKALEPAAAAVYFGSWIGFLALGQQYAVSTYNQSLDLSLGSLDIQLFEQEGRTLFSFKLGQAGIVNAPAEASEREDWLRTSFEALYGGTLRPLLESAAEAGGVAVGQLWGQFPTKFNYNMDFWLADALQEELRERIKEDYRYLREELPAEVFGRSKNPMDVKIRYIEDMKHPDKQVRIKNACCQFYRTEGGYYCYTCPRMKEEERAERREQARAAAASV
ncbi:(2Fe-2S)-binding protein [Paenibacillus puerhi]|uniref:(2Fe-2S)-binding protein n=1 Tax=Paenibacillus puerhi TaxID=2692622 RepID=UPI0038B3EB75